MTSGRLFGKDCLRRLEEGYLEFIFGYLKLKMGLSRLKNGCRKHEMDLSRLKDGCWKLGMDLSRIGKPIFYFETFFPVMVWKSKLFSVP